MEQCESHTSELIKKSPSHICPIPSPPFIFCTILFSPPFNNMLYSITSMSSPHSRSSLPPCLLSSPIKLYQSNVNYFKLCIFILTPTEREVCETVGPITQLIEDRSVCIPGRYICIALWYKSVCIPSEFFNNPVNISVCLQYK